MTIGSGELAAMRTELEALALPDTAILYAQTWGTVGGGGGTVTWTAASTVACHIAPLSAREVSEPVEGGRITPDVDRIVTLPANTSVSTEHRIEIDSTTYEVTASHAPRSYEVSRRVEVSEVL